MDYLQLSLELLLMLATAIIGYVFHKLKKRDEQRDKEDAERNNAIEIREEAINQALRALCRDRILQGYRYYKRNSGISTNDLETMTKLYNAYHGLGGNGTVTTIYDKICELPIKEGD